MDCFEEGYIIYKARMSGKIQIINWIMGMGENCEVIEPKELRLDVKNNIIKALSKYQDLS